MKITDLYHTDREGDTLRFHQDDDGSVLTSHAEDEVPLSILDDAPAGWWVWNGTVRCLTEADISEREHPDENGHPLPVGGLWWEGTHRMATAKEVFAFFDFATPTPTESVEGEPDFYVARVRYDGDCPMRPPTQDEGKEYGPWMLVDDPDDLPDFYEVAPLYRHPPTSPSSGQRENQATPTAPPSTSKDDSSAPGSHHGERG